MDASKERQALKDIVALIESHRPYWSDEVTDEIEAIAKEAITKTMTINVNRESAPQQPTDWQALIDGEWVSVDAVRYVVTHLGGHTVGYQLAFMPDDPAGTGTGPNTSQAALNESDSGS